MRRGFVIILVLAVLLLLAILAITYITLSLTDRTIARNYMDNKRARLVAQSGIEYAIARMQEINPLDISWYYESEQNPSFKAGDVTINGQTKGYSQVAGNTYGQDIFILKIEDSQGKININDGLDNPRVRANLARIVNNLAKVIDSAFPDIGTDIIGDATSDKRPQGGYSNVSEIRRLLIDKYGVTGDDYYSRLKPFITAHAWQDSNVANPVPLSQLMIDQNQYPVKYNTNIAGQNIYRFGRGKAVSGLTFDQFLSGAYAQLQFAPPALDSSLYHGIYALDELNPQWIEIVSRGPVNINTAEREVLIALLKDLKGFFVSDRRRNAPAYNNPYELAVTSFLTTEIYKYSFDYSPQDQDKDESGFLYTTDQINATTIADEIINCRKNSGTYATKWFGRQFKRWRQFHAFCDSLVEDKLKETRSIFYEYSPSTDELVSSKVARKQASQAMADCLKANFNPNLHLNESNPDANIKMLVDKIDLIVNSTEFCFTPMGYFEIESGGLILRPQGADNAVIAESKIEAVVKLYDCYRETNQKQFLQDGYQLEPATVSTNNSKTLEIGPEPSHIKEIESIQTKACSCTWKNPDPDCPNCPCPGSQQKNGTCNCPPYTIIVKEPMPDPNNEWGGYIALSTTNGTDPHPDATFYSHFSINFEASYHKGGDNYKANITTNNREDRLEALKGPYTYSFNNRLARSFRKESDLTASWGAPCDLRVDGAYIERHAGLAYDTTSVFDDPGMLCYWVKPSFYPETTGKPRTFFSLTKPQIVLKDGVLYDCSQTFANFFLPSHWPDSELGNEDNTVAYGKNMAFTGTFRGTSLLFGYATINAINGGIGHVTPFLNHLSHLDSEGDPLSCHPLGLTPKVNYLKSGHWIHIACIWDLPATAPPYPLSSPPPEDYSQIWINGVKHTSSSVIYAHPQVCNFPGSTVFRIEEATNGSADDNIRNWTCDSTVDEFYIFSIPTVSDLGNVVKNMYGLSRYYTLNSSSLNETSYISGILKLANDKNTPSESTVVSPLASGSEGTVATQKINVIGLSWTWYAEDTDTINVSDPTKFGKPILKDCKNYEDTQSTDSATKAGTFKYPVVKIKLIKEGIDEPQEYTNDGYSAVSVELKDSDTIQYKVIIGLPGVAVDTVLLYSPIFDDITIYYQQGVEFLAYSNAE